MLNQKTAIRDGFAMLEEEPDFFLKEDSPVKGRLSSAPEEDSSMDGESSSVIEDDSSSSADESLSSLSSVFLPETLSSLAEEYLSHLPYYEIQIKALKRRCNMRKIALESIKQFLTLSPQIISAILGGTGTVPLVCLAFGGYLNKEVYNLLELEDLYKQVLQAQQELKELIRWFNNCSPQPIRFARRGRRDLTGKYLLHKPHLISDSGEFSEGKSSRTLRWGVLAICTHIIFALASFITALIQIYSQDPKEGAFPTFSLLSIASLLLGIIAIVLDPIEEHFIRSTLRRSLDSYNDACKAFHRPVYTSRQSAVAWAALEVEEKQPFEGLKIYPERYHYFHNSKRITGEGNRLEVMDDDIQGIHAAKIRRPEHIADIVLVNPSEKADTDVLPPLARWGRYW